MKARTAERIESAVDAGAATLLAGAVGYALYALGLAQAAVAGGGIAFGLSFAGLRRVEGGQPAVSGEEHPSIPVADLLAEADRGIAAKAADELVLDDILAALGPESRVVRLFEPDAMQAPRTADGSQALHDALAELRRSLH